jgi:hypothetical protein
MKRSAETYLRLDEELRRLELELNRPLLDEEPVLLLPPPAIFSNCSGVSSLSFLSLMVSNDLNDSGCKLGTETFPSILTCQRHYH